jgi:hypothetical protein
MLLKVSRFNQLRTEKEQLKKSYSELEQVSKEKDIQVASLGSIAGEVSALYGLKTDSKLAPAATELRDDQVTASLAQLYALRSSAISGVATAGIETGLGRSASLSDWIRLSAAPTIWPVEGRITSSFGERIDPFNGEGAFHSGVDISTNYGRPILAPADGIVDFADFMNGYGRLVKIDHGHGLTTRFGHMSGFAVVEPLLRICITKSASTRFQSIRTSTCEPPWLMPRISPRVVREENSEFGNTNDRRGGHFVCSCEHLFFRLLRRFALSLRFFLRLFWRRSLRR